MSNPIAPGGVEGQLDAPAKEEQQPEPSSPVAQPMKKEPETLPPSARHNLYGKIDCNCVYTSDAHPVMRQRSRALGALPPLEPPIEVHHKHLGNRATSPLSQQQQQQGRPTADDLQEDDALHAATAPAAGA